VSIAERSLIDGPATRIAIALLSLCLVTAQASQAADPPRRIFAVGGAYMSGSSPYPLLNYVLSLSARPNPIVLCLPTSRGDSPEWLVGWYETMNQLPCRPRHLRVYGPTKSLPDFEKQLLAADIIFVPGGNSVNMLAIWKAQGIDVILRKAWERGIVLTGESAGTVCWFEQTITDSRPGALSPLECLGWLKGSACVHYNVEAQRKPMYHKLVGEGQVTPGIAIDDGVGLLFEGDKLVKVLSVSEKATAYQVRRDGDRVIEEPMKAVLLANPSKP
jgi:dipeptidase E